MALLGAAVIAAAGAVLSALLLGRHRAASTTSPTGTDPATAGAVR